MQRAWHTRYIYVIFLYCRLQKSGYEGVAVDSLGTLTLQKTEVEWDGWLRKNFDFQKIKQLEDFYWIPNGKDNSSYGDNCKDNSSYLKN